MCYLTHIKPYAFSVSLILESRLGESFISVYAFCVFSDIAIGHMDDHFG